MLLISTGFARRSEQQGVWGKKDRTEWCESAGSLLLLAAAQQTGLIAALGYDCASLLVKAVEERGLKQVTDTGAIESAIDAVMNATLAGVDIQYA